LPSRLDHRPQLAESREQIGARRAALRPDAGARAAAALEVLGHAVAQHAVEVEGEDPRRRRHLPAACLRSLGRSGMSRCLTPAPRSASTTALTTAGVEPIVAASPMPL